MSPIIRKPSVAKSIKRADSVKQIGYLRTGPRLTAKMKIMIGTAQRDMRSIIKDVVGVVSDIVDAVISNKTSIKTKRESEVVMNKITLKKLNKKREEVEEREKKEYKRKLRALVLKNELEEYKKDRTKKDKEEAELLQFYIINIQEEKNRI